MSVGSSGVKMSVLGNRIVIASCAWIGNSGQTVVVSYDTSGTLLHQTFIPTPYAFGSCKINQNTAGETWLIYTNGDQFTGNPTLYVRKMDSALNLIWQNTYAMPDMGIYVEGILDNANNFYFTYTSDSVAGQAHYLKAHTRKLNSSGSQLWHTTHQLCNYRKMMLTGGKLIMAGQSYTYYSDWMANDTGDVIVTFIDTLSGNEVFNDIYNGPTGTRDLWAGITTDASGNIYVSGTEDINTVQNQFSTFVRKYAPSGNILWTNSYPVNGGYSSNCTIMTNASGDIWMYEYKSGNSGGQILMNRRINAAGVVDSMISYSIAPLYIGIAIGGMDQYNGMYAAYQQVQCGGNRLGVIKFGNGPSPEGVNDPGNEMLLKVFPNPFHEILQLEFYNNAEEEYVIEIRDLTGRCVFTEKRFFSSGMQNISIITNIVSSGSYILSVKSNSSYFSIPVISIH
ncbi:MAG: hypothetical protein Fur0041_19170 [Bacteroidia bacterium]